MAEFTGIWIPAEVWVLEISIHEKVLLSQIIALDNENGCTADNKYFADFLGVSKVRVSEIINSLAQKKLITSQIKVNEGNKRILKRSQTFLYDTIKENNNTLANFSLIPSQTFDLDLAKKSLSLYKEENKYKAKDKTNIKTKEEEQTSDEVLQARILELEKENKILKEKKEKEKSSAKKEKEEPPSQAEFMDYAKSVVENELKKPFENYEFVIFSKYETWIADGWKDGNKKPILNWKSKFKNTLPYLKPVYGNINNSFAATQQPISNGSQGTNLFGKEGKSANRLLEIGKRTPLSKLRRKTTFEVSN